LQQCPPTTSRILKLLQQPLITLLQTLVSTVDLGDVGQKVEHTAGVTPLVVVPADKLDEVLVERDAGLGVEDGRVVVAVQVAGNDLVLGVRKDP
jgi:hypothetical protein